MKIQYKFLLFVLPFILCSCSPKTKVEETQKGWEAYETPRVIIPEDEVVYTNEEAGYRITFPENWRGNFVITEYSPDEICIGFYGESKTGQIGYKEYEYHQRRDGLDLAWIVSEAQNPIDGDKDYGIIGEAKGVEYILTSPRGGVYILDLIAINMPDSPDYSLIYENRPYPIDETELALAAQDWEKAGPMQEDIRNMNIQFESID